MARFLILLLLLALMLVGLPLAGVALAGKPLAPYLEFPPASVTVVHPAFSWWVFAATAAFIIVAVFPFVSRVVRLPASIEASPVPSTAFPWWGWLAIIYLSVVWLLAWGRFSWFAPVQGFTFSLLWLGYIVIVNALTWKRTGRCMGIHRPAYFLALFPVSAAFWWFFEYLNRFVQNWYYVGVGTLGPWEYFWQATLPFATVLPAVLGTRELLASFPRLSGGLENVRWFGVFHSKRAAWAVLMVSGVGLAAVGVWPNALFSLLWLAPLASITALQVIGGEASILDGPARGDWREIWQVALAGLVCGFFWELWNYKSLAHWEYAVPFVHRFELFHMPILGYSGYLPFGLECLAVAKLLDIAWKKKGRG
jgi:hypothetical protein